jgi:hypothetical protein
MTKMEWNREQGPTTMSRTKPSGTGGSPVYALGLVGALVYFWRRAQGGPGHLRAVGKAVVWPAFVVHDVLAHLDR